MVQSAVITAATGRLPERLAGTGAGAFNLVFFLGGAVSVALSSAILRKREDATSPLDPLFDGTRIAFSDAALVIVAFTVVGLLLALRFAPRPRSEEPAAELAAVSQEAGR
jgi:hypothetical protein